MLAAFAAVGATSFWMEAGRSGAAVSLWPLAVDEATSVVTVLALTPLVFAWTARLHPGRIGWPKRWPDISPACSPSRSSTSPA